MINFYDPAYSGHTFFGSSADYESAKAVIYGMPMDWTCTFRPGTRFGPKRIREVSINLEEYSPYFDRSLDAVNYFDAGDIPLPFGDVSNSLQIIENTVQTILQDDKIPIGLGGEHLVSYAPIKATAQKYQDLALIHFDAHADLRTDYEGVSLSHSTVIRKCLDYIRPENIFQFGIRSGTKEEFDFARKNVNFYPFKVLEPLKHCLPQIAGRPVYVTIDIDVLDPAFAPGTGTPDAGGITAGELLEAIVLLSRLDLKGFDLVEVAPVFDQSERTQVLASKVIREILLGL